MAVLAYFLALRKGLKWLDSYPRPIWGAPKPTVLLLYSCSTNQARVDIVIRPGYKLDVKKCTESRVRFKPRFLSKGLASQSVKKSVFVACKNF